MPHEPERIPEEEGGEGDEEKDGFQAQFDGMCVTTQTLVNNMALAPTYTAAGKLYTYCRTID